MLKEIFSQQKTYLDFFFKNIELDLADGVLQQFIKCKGTIVFTGEGKSGLIAEKLSKTMLSTGTKALYLSLSDALHGDLGIVSSEDLVVMISKSGNGQGLIHLAEILVKKNIKRMVWTSNRVAKLNQYVSHVMILPLEREICPFDLAPTTSTALQLLFGDILSVALMQLKKFSLDEYALNHPAGQIGKLIYHKVSDYMIVGDELPLCSLKSKLSDVIVELSRKRCGCLLVVDDNEYLHGVFTDGDLRRSLETEGKSALDLEIMHLMTKEFLSIDKEVLATKALDMMEGKVLQLPVLEEKKVVGLLHIHHLVNQLSLPVF